MPETTDSTPNSTSPEIVKILALDGGGLRGIFAAAALAAWEEDFGKRIVDYFDLIVGTSTGGIIALALGLGRRPQDILDLYVSNAAEIFPGARRSWVGAARWARRPKYSPGGLRHVLEAEFGSSCLGESVTRLAIPSYDLAADDVHLFRTPHHREFRRDWRVAAVDVALATSAAPTYFPAARLKSHRLVDGGVWANNPTLLGVVEAVDRLDAELRDIRVLSVGTTSDLRGRASRLDSGGLWAWRTDALDVVLRGQALASTNHARLLVGRENVVRFDVPIPSGLHGLDRVDPRDLIAKADAASRVMSSSVAPFLEAIASPYHPCYPEVPDGP